VSQTISDYLACRWSKEQIEEAQAQAFTAFISGVMTPVVITSSSMNGESTSGMEIAPGRLESFISDCDRALAKKRGEGTSNSNGVLINFGNRPVST